MPISNPTIDGATVIANLGSNSYGLEGSKQKARLQKQGSLSSATDVPGKRKGQA